MNSRSPARPGSGYGNRYGGGTPEPSTSNSYNASSSPYSTYEPAGPSFSAYPSNQTTSTPKSTNGAPRGNGALSMAELEHMESQSDEQVSNILGKIGRLKDLTTQIGDEIRSSNNLVETMNDGFSVTSQRLKGTMRRMLRMAEKTGVGWRVWLGFFAVVVLLFWYVWLF
jgi:blocked-early-in-transport protein 1